VVTAKTDESDEARRAEAEQVESGHRFGITCDCGAELQGRRPDDAQRVVCTECGRPWLVMPRRRQELSTEAAPKQQWRAVRIWFRRKRRRLGKSVAGFAKRTARRAAESPWLRPQRIAVLAVVAIVVLTVYIQIASRWQEDRAEELKRRWDAGQAALRDGDLAGAREELERAAELLPTLREPHPDARAIQLLALQVAMLDELLPKPLEVLAHEAHESGSSGDWVRTFDARYRGKAVLLFGTVSPGIGEFGQARYEFDYLAVDPRGRLMAVDASGLNVLTRLSLTEPRQIAVLARLGSAESVSHGSPEWVVRPDPESGTLVTSIDALRAARAVVPPQVEAVVREQAERAEK